MAAGKDKPENKRRRLIDPVYKKFTAKAFQTLASTEFYEYFMAMMSHGSHDFQFTNKRINKEVDPAWVDIIEATLPALDEICRNPRVIITQEELIINVVQARRVDSQVVRHLCSHGNFVESVDEDGNVVPSKILNLFKEESWDTYENRFVYTLLQKTHQFVALRYQKLFKEMNDEYGANLIMNCKAATKLEMLDMKMHLKLQQIDDYEDTLDRQHDIFNRIIKMYEMLCRLMESRFAIEMAKFSPVRPPLVPTNAIKKNPLLRKCHVLWDFLLTYKDVGYTIELVEQNPEINEKFEQDIWDNIMFTYIILKGYLEDTRDRALDYGMKGQSKKFKPKYIKEIVEEMIKDYDLPDIEVRKILIEELTKEQLMQEEQAERRRLVEERERAKKEKKRLEEIEKARLQKEKEKEEKRIALEKEKEKLRKQKEKEREELRLQREKEKKELSDAKKGELFAAEIQKQKDAFEEYLKKKEAARLKEEEARRKAEAAKAAGTGRKKSSKEAVEEMAGELAEEMAEELAVELQEEIADIIAQAGDMPMEMAHEIAEDIAEDIAEKLTDTIAEELEEEIVEEIEEHNTTDVSEEMLDDAIEESMEDIAEEVMEDVQEILDKAMAGLPVEQLEQHEREGLRQRLRKWLTRNK